jgi:ligand-binding sensor domain-containing protein
MGAGASRHGRSSLLLAVDQPRLVAVRAPALARPAYARAAAAGLTLAVAAVFSSAVTAGGQQAERFVFTNYGMEDGLSHGAVEAILQDSAGLLWIGTHDGVDRFDGRGFRAYRTRREDPTSLVDDYVLALAEAEGGKLWVGTEVGGLNLLDPLNGTARHFGMGGLGPWTTDVGSAKADRMGRTVSEIVVSSDGSLILITDVGLAWFDPRTEEFGSLAPSTSAAAATAMCRLSDGHAVVGFADGIVELFETGRPGTSPPDLSAVDHRLPRLPGRVDALGCAQQEGRFLAATDNGEVWELSLQDAGLQSLGSLPQGSEGSGWVVLDLIRMPDAAVWAATNHGAWRFPAGSRVPVEVSSDGADRGIPHEEVRRLFLDTRRVLWIGTWNGLASLHPLQSVMRRVYTGPERTTNLRGDGVIAIETDAMGRLWVGNDGGGVQRLDGDWRDGEATVVSPRSLRRWEASTVFGLAADGSGALWIAAFTDGLLRLEPDGRVVEVPTLTGAGESVTPVAYSVFVDHAEQVWAGSLSLGLLRFDAARGSFVPHLSPEDRGRLGSDFIWSIAEDGQGLLWIGAFNGGLASIGADRRTIAVSSAGPGGMSDNRILSVFVDSQGTVWAGTEGGGLNRFDPSTGEFRVYTVDEGIPHDNVEAVVEDERGYLWISTGNGLARLDRDTEEFLVFTDVAGLAGNRFWANSAHRGPGGALFFGGPAGITIVDPADIERRETPPAVALTAFRIQGREMPLARALAPGGLDLQPRENFFTFEFAALDFVDPGQNRYRYRLEGLDADWNDAGANPVANYTSVPPDRYVFRVAARNSEGIWNDDGLAIPIRVRAPFYQMLWFRSSVILAVLGLLSAVYSYRLRQFKARQELRLEIAGRLHDDIGANLSTIALKAGMVEAASTLDRRGRTHLHDVGQLARDSAHKVRETVWVVNTRYDTLAALVSKMRDTVDLILSGHVAYTFEAPSELPRIDIKMETRQNVYLMFKEVLHNVVKHAGASTVGIELAADARELVIRVWDDGVGLDQDQAGSGSGRALLDHRAALCRGTARVSSRPGGGTTVEICVLLR